MKIRVSKDKLLEALNQVIDSIGSRTSLPILHNTLVEAKDNTLTFSTTDLDIAATTTIEATVISSGVTTLPAKKLVTLCRELNTPDVDIEVNDAHQASIKCGAASFKLFGLAPEEFPPLPKIDEPREVTIEQSVLKEMLRRTSYAISTDETRYMLNGIFLSLLDKKMTMVATDGRRLALAEVEKDIAKSQEGDVILPVKAVMELNRLLTDTGDVVLKTSENRASFCFGNTTLITKLTDGKYPNYKQVIPSETKERVTIEREILVNALRRAAIFAPDKVGSVKFHFSKDNLTIIATTVDVGEGRESLPTKYRGKEFVISFNPSYVMDALRNLSDDEVHLDFIDELSPGVIRINSSNFLYVIMPMRG